MHKIVTEPFDLQQPCLQSWFEGIQHLPGSVLLHSGNSDHENARFHIASTSPLLTITLDANNAITTIFGAAYPQSATATAAKQQLSSLLSKDYSGADIIEFARQAQDILFGPHESPENPMPFMFGSIGYATYDFARCLEALPQSAEDPYDNPVFSIGFYTWSLVTDRHTNTTKLCFSDRYGRPDFSGQKENIQTNSFMLRQPWQSNMSEAEYVAKFNTIHDYLLAGDCYQVNLAQRFCTRYEGCEWQAWKTLQAANQSPFSAFYRQQNSCLLSVSPERFLAATQGLIETKPIKGTRPRFNDANKDAESRQALLLSEKDRAENLMIVDLLRNDISKNALPHSVKVDKLFAIESFQAVHHLVSTISAELKPGISPLTLMQDAFPGGSITGAPKVRAMEIIDELEPHRRNIYCGSIFYLGIENDFDSNICIRTLLLENSHIYCWAGGGIVADSEADMEYAETFHKVNKILPILANMT